MCKYIQANEESDEVLCQNIIDPPHIGTLSKQAHFDIIPSNMKTNDILVLDLYDANNVLQRQDAYGKDNLFNGHLIYSVDVSEVSENSAGVWSVVIRSVDENQDLVEISSFGFTVEYEETRPCNELEGEYYCCFPPLVCPKGNRIKEGVCSSGTCCNAQENCREPVQVTLKRQEINCEEAALHNCEKVVGPLYDYYEMHGPLDVSVVIRLKTRAESIRCFDKTDITIGYYDDANNIWIELPSDVIEVSNGVYEVSALTDYLGYIGVLKTKDCIEISCLESGGYQFTPTSGWVDIDETLRFKICGLVPGCDASRDGVCDKNCPKKMDPDCKQTSCSNRNDNCCLISKDEVCDPDCDKSADPDCCDKSKPGCCPGDITRSGYQGCDKSCGLADVACSALENGCTSEAGDCCRPADDGICDLDCSAPIGGGNPDPDCGAKTSSKGDSCNPETDGVCDTDCVFGVDADCMGGYVPYCGNGIRDSGETCECIEESCGSGCTYSCYTWWSGTKECAADVGYCYGSCSCPGDGGW